MEIKKGSIRAESGAVASSGGQRHLHCNCSGRCNGKKCDCLRAGQKAAAGTIQKTQSAEIILFYVAVLQWMYLKNSSNFCSVVKLFALLVFFSMMIFDHQNISFLSKLPQKCIIKGCGCHHIGHLHADKKAEKLTADNIVLNPL